MVIEYPQCSGLSSCLQYQKAVKAILKSSSNPYQEYVRAKEQFMTNAHPSSEILAGIYEGVAVDGIKSTSRKKMRILRRDTKELAKLRKIYRLTNNEYYYI